MRTEQELYVVISGEGEYSEKDSLESTPRNYALKHVSLTTFRGDGFHSVTNTTDRPLVIFVITTNEP